MSLYYVQRFHLGVTSVRVFNHTAHSLSPSSVGSLVATNNKALPESPQHAPQKPWLPGSLPVHFLNLLINESTPMWQQMLKGLLVPFLEDECCTFCWGLLEI